MLHPDQFPRSGISFYHRQNIYIIVPDGIALTFVLCKAVHTFCECEALASLRHTFLGSFFLEPEDFKSISLGAIWNFGKVTGLPRVGMGHKGPVIKA
jgi:hypothetical protein